MSSIQLKNELEFYSDPYDYVRGATASTERPTDDYRVHDRMFACDQMCGLPRDIVSQRCHDRKSFGHEHYYRKSISHERIVWEPVSFEWVVRELVGLVVLQRISFEHVTHTLAGDSEHVYFGFECDSSRDVLLDSIPVSVGE